MEKNTGSNVEKPPYLFKVELEKKLKTMTLPEFELFFEFRYLFKPEYAQEKYEKTILKKCIKAWKKGEISNREYWFGFYYQYEIRNGVVPDVIFKKIDDQKGFGVIANRNFEPNEWAGEYLGKFCHEGSKKLSVYNAYAFEYPFSLESPSKFIIDAKNQGNFTRFFNHSEKPNLSSQIVFLDSKNHIVFLTNRRIQKGEEMCYHYGDNYWKLRSRPQPS